MRFGLGARLEPPGRQAVGFPSPSRHRPSTGTALLGICELNWRCTKDQNPGFLRRPAAANSSSTGDAWSAKCHRVLSDLSVGLGALDRMPTNSPGPAACPSGSRRNPALGAGERRTTLPAVKPAVRTPAETRAVLRCDQQNSVLATGRSREQIARSFANLDGQPNHRVAAPIGGCRRVSVAALGSRAVAGAAGFQGGAVPVFPDLVRLASSWR
jgi:hypothetical protein